MSNKLFERRRWRWLKVTGTKDKNMVAPTFILTIYSTVATLIIVVLSVLYHKCGNQPNNQGNNGMIDERSEYEIGLINETSNNEECNCWTAHLPLTMLEIIVIGALCLAGMGLAVKLGIHVKTWMTNRKDLIKEKKLTKTAKIRKAILEEYQNGFPAHPESSEEKVELG